MMKAFLSLPLLIATPFIAMAANPFSGTYVSTAPCECLMYANRTPCPVAPPALNVFTNSVLQKNPYVFPSETGTVVAGPNGTKRSLKTWVYRTAIGSPEFRIREGDKVTISLLFKGNQILVMAMNETLPQPKFSFPLSIPPNQDGGKPGQPPQTKTVADSSGLVHTQLVGERYRNNGTGETGDKYSHYLFMVRRTDQDQIEVGRAADFKAKRDYSSSEPKTFNFEALRCGLEKTR